MCVYHSCRIALPETRCYFFTPLLPPRYFAGVRHVGGLFLVIAKQSGLGRGARKRNAGERERERERECVCGVRDIESKNEIQAR